MVTAIAFPFIIALATLVWFGIGGVKDIIAFFHDLKTMARDSRDDGRVTGARDPAFPVVPVEARGIALTPGEQETAAPASRAVAAAVSSPRVSS